MDQEDIKTLYEDKYQKILGLSYDDWYEQGPQSEAEAYARLQEIDDELKTVTTNGTMRKGIRKKKWKITAIS